jgi:hypothetical protein
MMPVPKHLRNCAIINESFCAQDCVVATVQCCCSNQELRIMFPGQGHHWKDELCPVVAEIDGNLYFVIVAKCDRCALEHLLIDRDFHGWEGVVCHDVEQASRPRPGLVAWACCACGKESHRIVVRILSEGEEDFIDQAPDLDPSLWIEAFSWFEMDVTCVNCGCATERFVSYEAM